MKDATLEIFQIYFGGNFAKIIRICITIQEILKTKSNKSLKILVNQRKVNSSPTQNLLTSFTTTSLIFFFEILLIIPISYRFKISMNFGNNFTQFSKKKNFQHIIKFFYKFISKFSEIFPSISTKNSGKLIFSALERTDCINSKFSHNFSSFIGFVNFYKFLSKFP